jgi:hypothetical protein
LQENISALSTREDADSQDNQGAADQHHSVQVPTLPTDVVNDWTRARERDQTIGDVSARAAHESAGLLLLNAHRSVAGRAA